MIEWFRWLAPELTDLVLGVGMVFTILLFALYFAMLARDLTMKLLRVCFGIPPFYDGAMIDEAIERLKVLQPLA